MAGCSWIDVKGLYTPPRNRQALSKISLRLFLSIKKFNKVKMQSLVSLMQYILHGVVCEFTRENQIRVLYHSKPLL